MQARWGLPEDIGRAVAMLVRGDLAYSTGQVDRGGRRADAAAAVGQTAKCDEERPSMRRRVDTGIG